MISTRGLRTLYFRGSYNESSKEYDLRSISGSTKYTDENYDSLKMNMIWGIGSKKVANSWDTNTWTLTNWKNLAKKSEGGAWYIWLGGIGVQKGGVMTTTKTTVIPLKTTETKSYSFVDLATKELFFETELNKAFGCINYDDDESYPLTIKYEIVSGLNSKNSLNQLIYYDSANLNKYNNLDSESVFNIVDFCDGNITKEKYFANDSGFTSVNTGSNFQQNMVGFSGTSKQVLCSIYLTYVFAYNNTGATEFDKSKHYVDMKFNDIFPKANASDITWDTTASVDNKIMSWIYYLLNPGEGQKYISTWFKTKVGGIFLGWHESIVGSGSSNVTTGSTRYLGMSGYATTPALTDVEWVTRGLSAYSSIVVYILIFMALVLLCYLLMGSLSIQRAVLGFIIFGVCVFVPPVAITATTDMINRVCDSLYSNKFEFWAICQCQTYIDKLDTLTDAGQSGNSFDYYSALIDATAEYGGVEDSSGGFSGAKLKWMSPKKFNELVELGNELDSALMNGYANYGTTASLLTNMISNATSGETYIDTATATYLYRDFLDIYRYSSSFSQQNHMRSLDAI